MGLMARETGSTEYEPIPEGMHPAVCYAVLDLGHQYSEKFKKYNHKALIMWEIPGVRITFQKEGQPEQELPRGVSKEYGVSLHRKAGLRNDLESWRGRSFTDKELEGFDISQLTGVNAMLQILHTEKDGKTYSNVKAIVPYPRDKWTKPENPMKKFIFGESDSLPPDLPEWVLEKIKQAKEWPDFAAKMSGCGTAPQDLKAPDWMSQTEPPVPNDEPPPF